MDEKLKELTPEDEEVLDNFLEVSAKDVDEATKSALDSLRGLLRSKALDEVEDETQEEPEESEEEDEDYVEFRNRVFADLDVEGMQGAFSSFVDRLTSLEAAVQGIASQVKEVKLSEDEKIARELSPAPDWARFLGTDKALESEDEEELLEQLKGSLPKPIEEVDPNNPLNIGLNFQMWPQ